ncbi:MAG: 50S ribosomal protein L18 [Spirochaetaceae bacterium]|jgi:large subunit ribosomal protein L18|nr:50S ribosomal protein L18 [Spirochaetaceae bacterium]
MDNNSAKLKTRVQRKKRIRKKISGTADRPRLTVYKSNRNISVQAIDDVNGKTLCSASSLEKDFKDAGKGITVGQKVGKLVAERLTSLKVKSVVFDRNGYLYHGVVKAVADSAREAGLEF